MLRLLKWTPTFEFQMFQTQFAYLAENAAKRGWRRGSYNERAKVSFVSPPSQNCFYSKKNEKWDLSVLVWVPVSKLKYYVPLYSFKIASCFKRFLTQLLKILTLSNRISLTKMQTTTFTLQSCFERKYVKYACRFGVNLSFCQNLGVVLVNHSQTHLRSGD